MTAQLVATAQDGGDFLSLQRRIIEIFKENKAAVVRVKAALQNAGENGKTQVTFGSGFFISREGHILTTANSTSNADRIWVEHKGIDYIAEMVGSDRYTNLALLQVLNLPENFSFLHLTNSPDLPPVGTLVIRISALFEFEPSPNLALVSGIESQIGLNVFRVPYIRTTLRTGPGEGGAPLLDLNGRLVGITVAALPPELESSYNLPVRAALRIRDDLLFLGKVTYGWIGFEVKEETGREIGSQIVLREIISNTPAEKAGLLVGDVLLRIDDYDIRNVSDVSNAVFYTREGQFITIKVRRGGGVKEFMVRVASRPADEPFAEAKISQKKSESAPPTDAFDSTAPPVPEPVEKSEIEPGLKMSPEGESTAEAKAYSKTKTTLQIE